MDDEDVKKTPVHELGTALDTLSVEELGDRVELLKKEIARLERAIEDKNASRSAADAVFKF